MTGEAPAASNAERQACLWQWRFDVVSLRAQHSFEGRAVTSAAPGAGGSPYEPRRPEGTLLYQTVRDELESFLACARERDQPAPRFIEHELRAYLRCGILAHGFLRLHCDDCQLDRLVPFSCKRRGFCPSCCGRRMADTAAHLVDRVIPEVPIRQWVLTLPYALRYRCAYDAKLTSEVLCAFLRALFTELRRRARRELGVHAQQCGAITFLQRFFFFPLISHVSGPGRIK